jgi:hypothetical protein
MSEPEKQVEYYLQHIDSLEREFLQSAERIMKAGRSRINKLDYFSLSVINRAISLNKGFRTLLDAENTLCAISLVRLQLDNLMRYNAILVCNNPFELMEHILHDKPINTYKEGKQSFSDSFLAQQLDKRFKSSFDLYKHLCNYIHYGYTHVDYIFREKEVKTEKSSHVVVIGDNDNFSLKDKIDYAENLLNISHNLIALMNEWAIVKDSDL